MQGPIDNLTDHLSNPLFVSAFPCFTTSSVPDDVRGTHKSQGLLLMAPAVVRRTTSRPMARRCLHKHTRSSPSSSHEERRSQWSCTSRGIKLLP